MIKRYLFIIIVFLGLIFLNSCLTVEKKSYSFEFNKDGSVILTLKFYNIMSQNDDGKDVSFKDFGELISDYLEGDKLLSDYKEAEIVDKQLYEKDEVLCGKAVFKFKSKEDAGFYQHQNKGPLMYYLGSLSETFESSNGNYPGTEFPVIFWDESEKQLNINTIVTTDMSNCIGLLGLYKTWKESK